MKKPVFLINMIVACALLLTVSSAPGYIGVFAAPDGPTEPHEPDAPTMMSDPIIVFEALDRLNQPADPEVLPVLPPPFPAPPPNPLTTPDLNDPFMLGSVPDVSGAVGHQYYLQAVNKMVALYPKDNSGVAIHETTFDLWWGGNGGATGTVCDSDSPLDHHGQPYVLYDHPKRQWVVTHVAYSDLLVDTGPYYICIAVSTETPTFTAGSVFVGADGFNWYYYAFETDDDQMVSQYPDQPKLGLWENGYYLAMDLIDLEHDGTTRTPRGVQVVAFDRYNMTTSNPPKPPASFSLPEHLGYEHLVPSTMLGLGTSDPDLPNYFASIQEGRFYIWEFQVNWNGPGPTYFGLANYAPNYILNTDTANKWAMGSIVGQPESGERVEAWGNRLTSPLVYRAVDNNFDDVSLWASHSVLDGNLTALRWYELKFNSGVPFFYQTGTEHPVDDPNYRWLPSMSVDRTGNMAIGYNMSNTIYNPFFPDLRTVYPSIWYTGRLSSDAPGLLPEDEHLLDLPGTPFPYGESQWDYWDSTPDGPWGRNSQMTVDPANDCVFWFTSMYYSSYEEDMLITYPGIIWHTRVGAFTFPECRGGQIKRVSLHTNNTEGTAPSGLNLSTSEPVDWNLLMYSVDISGTGRYVVFNSDATELIDVDGNNNRDVFVRDRDTDEDGIYDEPDSVRTTRVPAYIPGSSAEPNGDSGQVSISEDGRYIVFTSYATNLVVPDLNGSVPDIYLVDRDYGDEDGEFDESGDVLIQRISVSSGGVQGNGLSDQPFISADGRFIVYRSFAANLVTPDVGNFADIFLYDRDWNANGTYDEPGDVRTVRISQTTADVQADGPSIFPTVSDDGRYVSFASLAPNLGGGAFRQIYVRDRDTDSDGIWDEAGFVLTQMISTQNITLAVGDDDSTTPHIANGGGYLVYASRATNLLNPVEPTWGYQQIYVADLAVLTAPVNYLVSRSYAGLPANADSYLPSISRSGTGIVFTSDASNLDPFLPDANHEKDVFLYDWGYAGIPGLGTPERISLDTNLGEPNDSSFAPEINPDDTVGRHVAFVSEAYDLVPNDRNWVLDVFAYNGEISLPVFLRVIGTTTPVLPGAIVDVDVLFQANLQEIDSIIYAIDYDETCLTYLDYSIPGDTLPSIAGMVFNPPFYDPDKTDGELQFSIHNWDSDAYIPDSTIVATLTFQVTGVCGGIPGVSSYARVGFSRNPEPDFSRRGWFVRGIVVDGFIMLFEGLRADCNGDDYVNASDLSFLVYEIFDGDGDLPADVPTPPYVGDPVGCNPNFDGVVAAGDLSCTVRVIFYGPNVSCDAPLVPDLVRGDGPTAPRGLVELSLPQELPADQGGKVSIPVMLNSQGNPVNSLTFSVDYDQTWLSYDTMIWNVPSGYNYFASHFAGDPDGELDIAIYRWTATDPLPDGVIANIVLNVGSPGGPFVAQVASSDDPGATFGSLDGTNLDGGFQGGTLLISDWVHLFMPLTIR